MYYLGFIAQEDKEAKVYRTEEGGSRHPLDPRLDLRSHSPTGFQWGYGGSGPAQLALAILADHLGDDEQARELYQDFKLQVIARLPQEQGWVLTPEQINDDLAEIRRQQGV